MNGNWQEADTRVINFPDDEPDTFALYISYVYIGGLSVISKTAQELRMLDKVEFRVYIHEKHYTIFSVYILAEKLQDIATKNAMISESLAVTHLKGSNDQWHVPGPNTINAIYEGTPSNSPARRFVTDLWTAVSITSIFDQFQLLHKDFTKDLGESIAKARAAHLGNIPKKKGIDTYYENIEQD